MNEKLISLKQAAEQGILRVRLPIWANPLDHLKIDSLDGKLGPWIKLCAPANMGINGKDPVPMLCIDFDLDKEEYLPYTGPHQDSEEYQAEATRMDELFKSSGGLGK